MLKWREYVETRVSPLLRGFPLIGEDWLDPRKGRSGRGRESVYCGGDEMWEQSRKGSIREDHLGLPRGRLAARGW